MLAVVRPDSWNVLLFIHIAGAMALVATLVVAAYAIPIARTRGDLAAAQFAYRVLWRAVLPAWIVMRVGAQLIADKEDVPDSASWLTVGFSTSEAGLLLIIAGMIITGLAARRAKAGQSVSGSGGLRAATVLMGILLVAYVVAIWAMTTKPT